MIVVKRCKFFDFCPLSRFCVVQDVSKCDFMDALRRYAFFLRVIRSRV